MRKEPPRVGPVRRRLRRLAFRLLYPLGWIAAVIDYHKNGVSFEGYK